MIRKTLAFGNPAYLTTTLEQLVIRFPPTGDGEVVQPNRSIPIEDIGTVVLDHGQITLTQPVLAKLVGANCAVVVCDDRHMPVGMFLNLAGHTLQAERFAAQVRASEPLRKRLWQQTIRAKILNQALQLESSGTSAAAMHRWCREVLSGDTGNLEARAAAWYWPRVFPEIPGFRRERIGLAPNQLLNYGYAILRAGIARALTASGLLPTLGIHHHNRYNHFALADDIMEPYRPAVDRLVAGLVSRGLHEDPDIGPEVKRELLGVLTVDTELDGERSPLMVAASRTASSLAACLEGRAKTIRYPVLR